MFELEISFTKSIALNYIVKASIGNISPGQVDQICDMALKIIHLYNTTVKIS